jgi:hypothetical protein
MMVSSSTQSVLRPPPNEAFRMGVMYDRLTEFRVQVEQRLHPEN